MKIAINQVMKLHVTSNLVDTDLKMLLP